jgi:hypothetical protein
MEIGRSHIPATQLAPVIVVASGTQPYYHTKGLSLAEPRIGKQPLKQDTLELSGRRDKEVLPAIQAQQPASLLGKMTSLFKK